MVRNRAAREVPFGRDSTKPTGQAEMAEDNLASYRTSAEAELSSLQTGWVKINSKNRSILVSRRTFSEVARLEPPTIIYTYYDDIGQKQIVFVGFNPTTKTYKILTTRTNSSTEIEPSTEKGKAKEIKPYTKEGQAWIQCLHLAYHYYDFVKGEILPPYQELAKALMDEWMLERLQQPKVLVKLKEQEILVSRRTFSEVARSKLLTIVYNEKFDETTAPDDNQENNQNQTKKIVLVSFHPTTKTYEILIFQSPNGTTTTSPTKIDPLTEEGQAWIQCLHLAYSYYNFQQAKIQTEYEHLVDLVQDPSELIGTEQPDRHLQNPDSEDLLLSLPKVVDRWKDKILPFDSNSTILLKYLRIGPTGLENPEEPASRCPGLSWFDPYTYTYYTLLFRPDSKEYVLTYRYRKEQFLYIVTIKIEKINANTKQVKFSKQVTKQTQNLKPKSSSKNHTSSSRKAKKAKPQPDNPLPQAVLKPPVATSTVTPQTINPSPKENFSDLNSPNQTSTNVTEKAGKAGGHKVTLEVVESVSIEGRYPDLIQSLILLISLLHCAFPDYDFSLGKVKDKK